MGLGCVPYLPKVGVYHIVSPVACQSMLSLFYVLVIFWVGSTSEFEGFT